MSFQTGASSTSLAVADEVRRRMKEKQIVGSFGLGGIHAYFVKMLEEGLFRPFWTPSALIWTRWPRPGATRTIWPSAVPNTPILTTAARWSMLWMWSFGATEIDVDFNVNVVTGSERNHYGGLRGHSDCAAGAKLTIIVANLTRKNFCIVRDRVTTVTTPGETIDALVTEHGIAINPRRTDLLEAVKDSGLPIVDIHRLKELGRELVGPPGACSLRGSNCRSRRISGWKRNRLDLLQGIKYNFRRNSS